MDIWKSIHYLAIIIVSFDEQRLFNLTFYFIVSAFCIQSKKISIYIKVSNTCSYCSFIVLAFTFRSVIHFKLIFASGMSKGYGSQQLLSPRLKRSSSLSILSSSDYRLVLLHLLGFSINGTTLCTFLSTLPSSWTVFLGYRPTDFEQLSCTRHSYKHLT